MARSAFVGRREERDRVARLVRGDPGRPAVALVTGDAGIGKTRILDEVRRASADVTVLVGACLPLSESLPYGALADAFTALTGPEGRPLLDRALARCAPFVRPQLSALVPALVVDGYPGGAGADRTALFSAVRDLLGALAAERRTVLVIEDLHWADVGTLDLLTFLIRGLPDGTALVASSRRDELVAGDRVLDWQEATMRGADIEHIALGPLPDHDVASLVAALVGPAGPDPELVADVQRRAQGNPFFTEQLVAAERDVERPAVRSVPPTVAHLLLARVRSVGPAAADAAAVLAVVARPLAEDELVSCLGDPVAVAAGLDELLEARLVEATEDGQYRLRHALLEDTVSATLLPSRRASLHAAVAAVLAARGGEAAAEVAAHWGRAGEDIEEARWSVAAARHAESVYAWREAAGSWRRVWDLWDRLPDSERPAGDLGDVVVSCVECLRRGDDEPAFAQIVELALADERLHGDDWSQARLHSAHAPYLGSWDRGAEIASRVRAAALYERTGRPSGAQAANLFLLADIRRREGCPTGTEHADKLRAADIAAAAGSVEAQVSIGSSLAVDRVRLGEIAEGVAELERLLALAAAASGREAVTAEAWTAVMLTDVHLWLLRLPDVAEVGRRAIERGLAHGLGDSFPFEVVASNLVDCLILSGDVPAVRALLGRHATPTPTRRGWPLYLGRAELDVLAGHPDEALRRVQELRDLDMPGGELRLYLDEVATTAALWAGDPGTAWAVAESGLALLRGDHEGVRTGRLLSLAARATADLAEDDATADRDEPARWVRAHADATGCLEPHPARVMGGAYGTTCAAELARLARHGEEAAWRTAGDTWAGHGVPHQAAYAGWRLAELLLDAGRRAEAESELAAAHGLAAGHVPLRREIAGLARRARLPLPDEAPAQSPAAGQGTRDGLPYGLTPRELDVLRLLATGATNVEIGRRLYMSPKTASVHVTAILRKLGVRGRVQAATVAERMGLVDGRQPTELTAPAPPD